MLGGMAGLAAAAALSPALAAKARRLPPRLRVGDTVGLVAPSSAVDPAQVEAAAFQIAGMGLVPRIGAHVSDVDGYLAGTDANRAADLDAMFADDEVRAIFAVRGGWGAARLLPLLDWKAIASRPKLVIGSSDITALHLAIAARAGFPTIHAPTASSRWVEESWQSLWRLAFTGETPVLLGPATEPAGVPGPEGRTITGGTARGRLIGGNLTIVSTLMGTGWLPDLKGAVLFLEDIGEEEYRIDRMLQQLALGGVLAGAAGIVFGRCSRCANEDPDYRGFTLDQVIDHHLGPLGIPAFVGGNIGHVRGQTSLPSGGIVELDAAARTIRLLEPIVG